MIEGNGAFGEGDNQLISNDHIRSVVEQAVQASMDKNIAIFAHQSYTRTKPVPIKAVTIPDFDADTLPEINLESQPDKN